MPQDPQTMRARAQVPSSLAGAPQAGQAGPGSLSGRAFIPGRPRSG